MVERSIDPYNLTPKQLLRLAESALPPIGSDSTLQEYQGIVPVDGSVDVSAGTANRPPEVEESDGELWREPRTRKLWRKKVVGRQPIVHGSIRGRGSIVSTPKARGVR